MAVLLTALLAVALGFAQGDDDMRLCDIPEANVRLQLTLLDTQWYELYRASSEPDDLLWHHISGNVTILPDGKSLYIKFKALYKNRHLWTFIDTVGHLEHVNQTDLLYFKRPIPDTNILEEKFHFVMDFRNISNNGQSSRVLTLWSCEKNGTSNKTEVIDLLSDAKSIPDEVVRDIGKRLKELRVRHDLHPVDSEPNGKIVGGNRMGKEQMIPGRQQVRNQQNVKLRQKRNAVDLLRPEGKKDDKIDVRGHEKHHRVARLHHPSPAPGILKHVMPPENDKESKSGGQNKGGKPNSKSSDRKKESLPSKPDEGDEKDKSSGKKGSKGTVEGSSEIKRSNKKEKKMPGSEETSPEGPDNRKDETRAGKGKPPVVRKDSGEDAEGEKSSKEKSKEKRKGKVDPGEDNDDKKSSNEKSKEKRKGKVDPGEDNEDEKSSKEKSKEKGKGKVDSGENNEDGKSSKEKKSKEKRKGKVDPGEDEMDLARLVGLRRAKRDVKSLASDSRIRPRPVIPPSAANTKS